MKKTVHLEYEGVLRSTYDGDGLTPRLSVIESPNVIHSVINDLRKWDHALVKITIEVRT